jgi:hypothetical protein
LLAHRAGVFDPFFLRKRDKLGWRLGFEVLKFYFPHWDGPVEYLGEGLRDGLVENADEKSGKSAGLSKESAGKASNLMRRPVH